MSKPLCTAETTSLKNIAGTKSGDFVQRDFCYSFITTDNLCGFEQKREEKVQHYMLTKGITREEAIRKLDEEVKKHNNLNLDELSDSMKEILKNVYPDWRF